MPAVNTSCAVCGANLTTSEFQDTCGVVCGRVVQYGEPRQVAEVRAKIEMLGSDRCSPGCPGWAVFNADTEPVLEPCIDCWHGAPTPLYVEDVELLPEAQRELERAKQLLTERTTFDVEYDQPYRSDKPCACGCSVFRACAVDPCEHCCACDDARPTKIANSPILARVFAVMDEAEEINGPEGDDYVGLMRAIEGEARRRRYNYGGADVAKDKTPLVERGAESVINQYRAMLDGLIAQESDDVDDLASWAAALEMTHARVQREVTLRLTRELRARPALPRRFRLVAEVEPEPAAQDKHAPRNAFPVNEK